jgi:hypothetical protein
MSCSEADSDATSQSSFDVMKLLSKGDVKSPTSLMDTDYKQNIRNLMDQVASLKAEKFLMEQDWKERYSKALKSKMEGSNIDRAASSSTYSSSSSSELQNNHNQILSIIKKDLSKNAFLISEERFHELKSKDPSRLEVID